VIRFEQPSGLPVLTMALEPASVETGDADLAAMLRGLAVSDALRHRWWTLRCESLEVLPTEAWRVMATLTAGATTGLVELRFEIDPGAGDGDCWYWADGGCWIDGPLAWASGPGLSTPRSSSTSPCAPDK
jgi:hypothetical protein